MLTLTVTAHNPLPFSIPFTFLYMLKAGGQNHIAADAAATAESAYSPATPPRALTYSLSSQLITERNAYTWIKICKLPYCKKKL